MGVATVAAAGACAIPIPVADTVALMGIQTAMLSQIAKIYGIKLSGDALSLAIPQLLTSLVGKMLAARLTKLIPGWGSAINAAVGGGWTASLGMAWSTLCERDWLGKESILLLAETSQLGSVLNDLMADAMRKHFRGKS